MSTFGFLITLAVFLTSFTLFTSQQKPHLSVSMEQTTARRVCDCTKVARHFISGQHSKAMNAKHKMRTLFIMRLLIF